MKFAAALFFLLLAGCYVKNKDLHPCTDNANCTDPAAPVCDLAAQVCVECTPESAAACTGQKPICGADNVCRACTAHADCLASMVCLPDGSCGIEDQVAYVANGGTSATCAKSAPCNTLTAAILLGKPYIKVASGEPVKDTKTTTIDGKVVTILADPGARLDREGDGPILEIRSPTTDVKIYDLEITGASGATGADAIILTPNGGTPKLTLTRVKITGNQGLGISASGGALTISQSTLSGNTNGGISISGGALTVSQSTFSGNANGISINGGALAISRSTLSGNANGGISITGGTFDIVNNFFFSNGGLGSSVGGLVISTTQNAANRLEFNSFNKNQTQDGIGPSVHCVAGAFTARNNIMSGPLSQAAHFGGTCQHAYSVATPGTLPPGTGNVASNPMFVNTTTGDLHLSAASPARGMADPASALTGPAAVDIDGQPRTAPADIGADEYNP